MSEEKQEVVQGLTAKEIKKLARPEFAANPDKFYPTDTLRRLGFSRNQCPVCENFYWRHTTAKTTCGDSQCEKKYSFIGVGTGIGKNVDGKEGKKITYADAWQGFKRSLTSARIPCTAIPRYPVVARWRDDVDFVAAGIFCFQPYCVTGELDPPANPLICPQFCLRFNDLDNIGLTGRHYSGFIMLGIQVFNKPDAYKFWNHECVEFNHRWLTEELGINPDEITFIEDVWAGGGNLGPSIEYFVNGLELGNMVFMQFKTFPDGRREPLQVQVIDVGIGLERVPWLINGSPTSYCDVFPRALDFALNKLDLSIKSEIWEKYGPLSCLLNVDEVEDISATWNWIAKEIGQDAKAVKEAIEPIKDLYVILDHTRSALMAITDGSLPSNTGGAANIRNIIRRTFAILKKRGWWEKFGMEGFLQIFEHHKEDLATIYGAFKPFKSFRAIIEKEYEKWCKTDESQATILERLVKKRGKGKLSLKDWIDCVTSYGIPADTVAAKAEQEVPGNLWYAIAELQERQVKSQPAQLYNMAHLKPTHSLYFASHEMYEFDAKIVAVVPNVTAKNVPSIVVLDQSAFYPFSGGQENDTGKLVIEGKEHKVVDVIKVGPVVMHVIDPALPADRELDSFKDLLVHGHVDSERRVQLRNHHTATHIVFAACRQVLGPHVWQSGANKTTEEARLDITHYDSLSFEDLQAIEIEANRIVQRCKVINKSWMPKEEAEGKYGFSLYQGGIVPGNEVRVVNIADTDTEACCGTHCDNTAEVGCIKILRSLHTQDGIARLYYVAGETALKALSEEHAVLNSLLKSWRVEQKDLVPTANRFFEGYKHFGDKCAEQSRRILDLQTKVFLLEAEVKLAVVKSDEESPTLYISGMPAHAESLKSSNKGMVFVGSNFAYALLGNASQLDVKEVEAVIAKAAGPGSKARVVPSTSVTAQIGTSKGKAQKVKVTDVLELKITNLPDPAAFLDFVKSKGFLEMRA